MLFFHKFECIKDVNFLWCPEKFGAIISGSSEDTFMFLTRYKAHYRLSYLCDCCMVHAYTCFDIDFRRALLVHYWWKLTTYKLDLYEIFAWVFALMTCYSKELKKMMGKLNAQHTIETFCSAQNFNVPFCIINKFVICNEVCVNQIIAKFLDLQAFKILHIIYLLIFSWLSISYQKFTVVFRSHFSAVSKINLMHSHQIDLNNGNLFLILFKIFSLFMKITYFLKKNFLTSHQASFQPVMKTAHARMNEVRIFGIQCFVHQFW